MLLALFVMLMQAFVLKVNAKNGILYTSKQLTSSRTQCVVQDRHGYIWIGSDYGLNRFDGYTFKKYTNTNVPKSILSNDIVSLYVSRKSELWIGCGRGLCRYDYAINGFVKYSFPNNIFPRVNMISEDINGDILIGTAGFGLFQLHGRKIYQAIKPLEVCNTNFFNYFFVGKNNYVWHVGNSKEIVCTNLKTKKNYRIPYPDKYGCAYSMSDYHGKGIVVACAKGILYYDFSKKQIRDAGYDLDNVRDTEIRGVRIDRKGDVYVMTRSRGIYIIKKGKRKALPLMLHSIPIMEDAYVNDMLEDRCGNLWFCCFRSGLYELMNSSEMFTFCGIDNAMTPRGCNLSAIVPFKNDSFLASIYSGWLYEISSQGEIVNKIESPKGINSIIGDNGGNYWLCGYGHLWKYDSRANSFISEKDYEGFDIRHIALDRKQRLYYCLNGYALGVYDIKNKKSVLVNRGTPKGKKGFLVNSWIQHIMIDSHGYVWMATADGVSCYDADNDNFCAYGWNSILKGVLCYCTIEDKNENIIIGSNNGLYVFSKKKNKVMRLPGSAALQKQYVYSMLFDNDGKLWLSTSSGIWRYDAARGNLTSYINNYGLKAKEYIQDAAISLDNGHIVFGTDNGSVIFNPSIVTATQKMNNDVFMSAFIVDNVYQDCRSMNFETDPGPHIMTVELSLFNYENTENVIYQYKLDDKEWKSLDEGDNSFELRYLFPGKYKLYVRAYVNGCATNVKMFHIQIHSPWYATWWAFIFYAIFLSITSYLAYQWISKYRRVKMEEKKFEFLINATHDIRSPLTLITGPVAKLKTMLVDNAEALKYANIISRNADRMLTLVNQIMDAGKIDKQLMEIKCTNTDMVTYINGIISLFQYHASEIHVKITQSSSDCKIYAYIDRMLFEKVITNLLSNAVKYSVDGGNINVDLQVQDNTLVISVSDSGVGFSNSDINKIFDRFYQGQNSKLFNVTGTGLGLSLCRQLVELHHGKIKARNRNDGCSGAVFVITLPLGKGHLKPEQLLSSEDEHLILRHNSRSDKQARVLIADDDMELSKYVQFELSEWYTIDIVGNGQEALDSMLKKHYDLVISDVVMPKMDGITLLKKIKGNVNISDIPVILLTSKIEVQDRLEGIKCGADAFISKPFNVEELRVVINNLIDNVRRIKGKYANSQVLNGISEKSNLQNSDDKIRNMIVKLVYDNYSNSDFGVEQLALEVGLSRVQLHRRMKEFFGMPVSDYIRNARLQEAASMLKTKNANVSQVAYDSGFNSAANFSTMFKKCFGVSPSEYAALK